MKKRMFIGALLLAGAMVKGKAQEPDTVAPVQLPEVRVKAFEQGRSLRQVPAAVLVVGPQALARFAPLSPVAAVNTAPGIRMEERSPGSYRFNIRGSALRSPFGVRNVKVYYNDLPFTLPGGTTYLNQLGFYNYRSLEVIKGPGSSLYGAGTGGVLLIESLRAEEGAGLEAGYTLRSYGTHQAHVAVTTGDSGSRSRFQVQHQTGRGYRQHSAMERTVADWTGSYQLGESTVLRPTFLWGNLQYETPGALTLAEFNQNPKRARPNAEAFAAAIYQQTFLAGASLEQQVSGQLQHKTVLYAAATRVRNPNLRGYDESTEPHTGIRTVFSFYPLIGTKEVSIQAGAEVQAGWADINNYKNVAGRPDSLRYTDAVRTTQGVYFAQGLWTRNHWTLSGGVSLNSLDIAFQRFQPQTAGGQNRRFKPEWAGRLALLRSFESISVYSSVSRGFSPPTLSELLPTGGAINTALEAESGTSYDVGIRGTLNRLSFDLNLFLFALQRTIVQRRDSAGGDFYLNSGKTRQNGAELSLQYRLLQQERYTAVLWLSYTGHNFRYRDFRQLENNFSGKRLPGVVPHTLAAGADLHRGSWGFFVQYLFGAATPLNDANTATAPAYHLLGMQVQHMQPWGKAKRMRIFAGAENLLDQQYSLGNDLNAFGGRYYNAAAGRNFFAGVSFSLDGKK